MAKLDLERMTPEQRQRFAESLIDTMKQAIEVLNSIKDYKTPPESAA